MIVFLAAFAVAFMISWTQPWDELVDAIVVTTGWAIPIRSHDLEITQRRTSGVGDGTHEQVRIIREVYDSELDKFLMCNSVGSWSLDLATGEVRDGGKTSFFEGTTKTAIRHVEGYGASNTSSKTGDCVIAARELDLGLLPLTFVHSANAELETRNFILEYITRNERDASVDEIDRSHFGKVKKQKRFRFYKENKNAVGRMPVGIELCVSAEGHDDGFITELRLCFLKPSATTFEADSDVSYCQCSVRTKWAELDKTNSTIVPVEIDQRFSDGGQSITKTTTLDWKHVNPDKSSDNPVSAKSTLDEFKASVGNIKSRVDKLLNR